MVGDGEGVGEVESLEPLWEALHQLEEGIGERASVEVLHHRYMLDLGVHENGKKREAGELVLDVVVLKLDMVDVGYDRNDAKQRLHLIDW